MARIYIFDIDPKSLTEIVLTRDSPNLGKWWEERRPLQILMVKYFNNAILCNIS